MTVGVVKTEAVAQRSEWSRNCCLTKSADHQPFTPRIEPKLFRKKCKRFPLRQLFRRSGTSLSILCFFGVGATPSWGVAPSVPLYVMALPSNHEGTFDDHRGLYASFRYVTSDYPTLPLRRYLRIEACDASSGRQICELIVEGGF